MVPCLMGTCKYHCNTWLKEKTNLQKIKHAHCCAPLPPELHSPWTQDRLWTPKRLTLKQRETFEPQTHLHSSRGTWRWQCFAKNIQNQVTKSKLSDWHIRYANVMLQKYFKGVIVCCWFHPNARHPCKDLRLDQSLLRKSGTRLKTWRFNVSKNTCCCARTMSLILGTAPTRALKIKCICTLHYNTLRCVTLHYVILRYITLFYVTYIPFHYITWNTLHYVTLTWHDITWHRLTSLDIARHYMAIHDNTWHYIYVTLHYTTLQNITLRNVTLPYVTLHYIHSSTFHYITLSKYLQTHMYILDLNVY